MHNRNVGELLVKRDKYLHVEFTVGEFEALKKIRGDQKWRAWLLSLPDQFRNLHERAEMFKLMAENSMADNEDLKERVRSLQSQVRDMEE